MTKRPILFALSTLVIVAGLVLSAPPAECSGCSDLTKQFCQDRSTEAFMDCVNEPGHTTEYCLNRQDEAYDACMTYQGCPIIH